MHQFLRRAAALALSAGILASLPAVANAQGPVTRNIQLNALRAPDGSKLVLEAQTDKSIKLVPVKANNLRQRWVQESSSFGGVTFRNVGVFNQCLRDTGPQSQNQNLRVGSCTDLIAGRQRWKFRTGSVGNTGVQIQNQATGRVVMQFISDFTDFDVEMLPLSLANSFPNSSEWRLPAV